MQVDNDVAKENTNGAHFLYRIRIQCNAVAYIAGIWIWYNF